MQMLIKKIQDPEAYGHVSRIRHRFVLSNIPLSLRFRSEGPLRSQTPPYRCYINSKGLPVLPIVCLFALALKLYLNELIAIC